MNSPTGELSSSADIRPDPLMASNAEAAAAPGAAAREKGAPRPVRSLGDEVASRAGVRLGDLAREVGLGGRHVGDPLDLGGAGSLLVGVGKRQDGLLVGGQVRGA